MGHPIHGHSAGHGAEPGMAFNSNGNRAVPDVPLITASTLQQPGSGNSKTAAFNILFVAASTVAVRSIGSRW